MVVRGFISNYANAVASSKNRGEKKKSCISRKLLIQIKHSKMPKHLIRIRQQIQMHK